MKKPTKYDLLHTADILLCYGVIYALSRLVFDVNGPFPVYTFGWTARHICLLAAIVSALGALFGKRRFAYTALVGYVLGNLLGELLGGIHSHIPPQYLHHGWWIFLLVYLLSCVLGLWWEKKQKHANRKTV